MDENETDLAQAQTPLNRSYRLADLAITGALDELKPLQVVQLCRSYCILETYDFAELLVHIEGMKLDNATTKVEP